MESHDSWRAVLRLRTLAPYGINETQEEIVDRLRTLVEHGPLADLDVDAWGTSVRTVDGTDGPEVRETVEEFTDWANRNGYSLTPAFEWRETESFLEEERGRGRVVVLPLLCLAVYDGDGKLEAVYPHRDGEEILTIHDGVEALESLRSPEAAARPGEPLSSRL